LKKKESSQNVYSKNVKAIESINDWLLLIEMIKSLDFFSIYFKINIFTSQKKGITAREPRRPEPSILG